MLLDSSEQDTVHTNPEPSFQLFVLNTTSKKLVSEKIFTQKKIIKYYLLLSSSVKDLF